MLRNAIVRAARTLAVPRPAFTAVVRPAISNKPAFTVAAVRAYSAGGSLSKVEVESRILDLLKGFDKISDPTKLTPTSHFSADLGLDSLDAVEVVMAIEEEFNLEIPDKDADNILSVEQAVNYVLAQPDAH